MNKLNSMGSTQELTPDEQQFRALLGEYLLDQVLKGQTPLEPISTFLQEKYPEMMNDIKCLVEKHHGNLAEAINNLSAPQKNHLHAILGYYVIDQASKVDNYSTYRKDLFDSTLSFVENWFKKQFDKHFLIEKAPPIEKWKREIRKYPPPPPIKKYPPPPPIDDK